MRNFELEKNFDERKYLSVQLLNKLKIKKHRKLIEKNDEIYFNGKYGYKLTNKN